MSKAKDWVDVVTGGMSMRDLARALGASHSTINRRLNNDDPELIALIGRHFGANPIGLLINIGFLQVEDVRNYAALSNLDNYDDIELAEEIVRRLKNRQTEAFEATVFEFPQTHSGSSDTNDGTVTQWRDTTHAADSSPDETEERLTRGEDPID